MDYTRTCNYKSALSEYCQKKGYKYPVYSHQQFGQSHCPVFLGHCEFNGTLYTTEERYSSSKQAEQAAAQLAFEATQSQSPVSNSVDTDTDNRSGILSNCLCIVDLDNQNKFKEIEKQLREMHLKKVVIMGVGGPRLRIPPTLLNIPEVSFRNTDILTRDAADIELAIDAYKFAINHADFFDEYTRLRVFSTDFALKAIVDILKRDTVAKNASFHCDFLEWLYGQAET